MVEFVLERTVQALTLVTMRDARKSEPLRTDLSGPHTTVHGLAQRIVNSIEALAQDARGDVLATRKFTVNAKGAHTTSASAVAAAWQCVLGESGGRERAVEVVAAMIARAVPQGSGGVFIETGWKAVKFLEIPFRATSHGIVVEWATLEHDWSAIEGLEEIPAGVGGHDDENVFANGCEPPANDQAAEPPAANLRRSPRHSGASSSSSSSPQSSQASLPLPLRRASAAASRPRSSRSDLPLQQAAPRKQKRLHEVALNDQDDDVGLDVPPPPPPAKRQRSARVMPASVMSPRALMPPLLPPPHHFPAGTSAPPPAQPAQPSPPSHLPPVLSPAPQAGPASSIQRTTFPTRSTSFPTGSVSLPPPQRTHAPPSVLVEPRQPAPVHQAVRAAAAPPPGLVPAPFVHAPPTSPAVAPDPAPIDVFVNADLAPINAVAAADPALMAAAAALDPRRVHEIHDALVRLGPTIEELTNLLQAFGPMMEDVQRMLRQQEQQEQQQQEQRRGGGGGGGWYAGVLCIVGVLLWMGM